MLFPKGFYPDQSKYNLVFIVIYVSINSQIISVIFNIMKVALHYVHKSLGNGVIAILWY